MSITWCMRRVNEEVWMRYDSEINKKSAKKVAKEESLYKKQSSKTQYRTIWMGVQFASLWVER